ncbi:MAG: ThiF family adenylyltransferase [Kiritimatiellia bacterium]
MDPDSQPSRFSGVGKVLGREALDHLAAAHACVIGIGGVGSWAAEALARTGVGEITLIDLDDICVHNINRQIHAATSSVGRLKVDVMAARILDINPGCRVHPEAAFLTPKTADHLLARPYGVVVDGSTGPGQGPHPGRLPAAAYPR